MQTYTKADFFILYRGWNNKLSAYCGERLCQFNSKQWEVLKDCIISINGTSYKVTLDKVTKLS
jgi:hypothetical protein